MAAHGPVNDQEPGDQSDKEQDLPEPSQFQILPSLMTEPEPPVAQEPLDPRNLTQKASACNNENRGKEDCTSSPCFRGSTPPMIGAR